MKKKHHVFLYLSKQIHRSDSKTFGTDIVEAVRRILAEREKRFIKQSEKLPPEKRKQPDSINSTSPRKRLIFPLTAIPQCIIVGASRQLQVMQWGIYPRTAKPEDLERYAKGNWFKNAHGEKIYSEKTWPYYHLIHRISLVF